MKRCKYLLAPLLVISLAAAFACSSNPAPPPSEPAATAPPPAKLPDGPPPASPAAKKTPEASPGESLPKAESFNRGVDKIYQREVERRRVMAEWLEMTRRGAGKK